MDKFNITLHKYVMYAVYAIMLMSVLNTCNSCSNAKDNVKMRKEIDSLTTQVEKFESKVYTKDQMDTKLEIEGIKTSRRTLYDWNSVVRTVNRPDDIINGYNTEIQNLEKKIK